MKNLILIPILLVVLLCAFCGGEAEKPESSPEIQPTEQSKEEPPVFPPSPEDGRVILTINNKNFTNKDLKDFITGRYSADSLSVMKDNPRILSRTFDAFVEHQTVLFEVNRENMGLEDHEMETYLQDKRMKQEETEDNSQIRDSIRIHKYLNNKVYKDIDVTDAEIRRYYEANIDSFRRKSEVLLHQIVIKDRDKAFDARRRLMQNPDSFAQIAADESEARDGKNGGRVGYFSKGTLPKDMEDVVFSLKIDEISPVTPSPYGYIIFKVTKQKEQRLLALETVINEIRNKLLSDKMSWAYEDFLARLKKQLVVDSKYGELYFTYHPVNQGDQNDKTKKSPDSNPGGSYND